MEAREKIFKAFYESGRKWLYFTEIKNLTRLSNSSMQNALTKLLKIKQMDEDKKTSNIYYKINETKKPLIFSSFDKERLDSLHLDVKTPLKNLLKLLPPELEFIMLFGSSSRKQEKDGSDIDLLVVLHAFEDIELQKLYEKEIKRKIENLRKKINSESNYPLNIVYTNLDNFKTSKDHLILQAKETGFPIYGNLEYYKHYEED